MKTQQTKKIIAVFAVSLMAVMAAGGASADFEASNSSTGFDSNNITVVQDIDLFTADNINTEVLDNIFSGSGNTGYNLGDGLIETGDIDAVVLTGDVDNVNALELDDDLYGLGFDALALNHITGALSDNEAVLDVERIADIDNVNTADLDNDLFLTANTGFNEAEGWFGSGIETGDAEANIKVINSLNRNFVALAADMGIVDALVGNTVTGYNSDNDAVLVLNNVTDLDSTNVADVDNGVYVALNTGYNVDEGLSCGGCGGCALCGGTCSLCNECDAGCDLLNSGTGDAVAAVTINNAVNKNDIEIDSGLGIADIEVGNSGTGACSDNGATAVVNQLLDVTSINSADIDNNVAVVANTGYNATDEGWDDSGIETGNAGAAVVINNQVNENSVDLDLNSDLDLSATNSCTGEGSDNTATAVATQAVGITNVNAADISNNVAITTNTGGNVSDSGSCGFGCGSGISTGNSAIMFGVTNAVNNNSF